MSRRDRASVAFDLEVYRYRLDGKLLRLTRVMSFRAGIRQELPPAPDQVLPLSKATVPTAVKAAFDFLRESLPEIGKDAPRGSRILLLLDDAGLEVIKDWCAEEIAFLAWWDSTEADYLRIRTYPSRFENFPFRVYVGNTPFTGLVRRNGVFQLMRVDRVGPERESTKRYTGKNRGWKMIGLEVVGVHACEAPQSMLDAIAADKLPHEIADDLGPLFWRDVAPLMEDPLVNQRHLVIQDRVEDESPWLQPAPEVVFEHGSERELLDLVRSYFILRLTGKKVRLFKQAMTNGGDLHVYFKAGYSGLPPELDQVNSLWDDGRHPVLKTLIAAMNPTGYGLAGGPRLSQATRVPATIICTLFNEEFGLHEDRYEEPSAHELMAHAAKLIDFLSRHGMPEARAQKLISKL